MMCEYPTYVGKKKCGVSAIGTTKEGRTYCRKHYIIVVKIRKWLRSLGNARRLTDRSKA